MKSRSRQLIVTVLITSVLSILIGGFAVFGAYQSDIDLIDSEINLVINESIQNLPNSLNQAVLTAEENNFDLAIIFLDSKRKVTFLRESRKISDVVIPTRILQDAVNRNISVRANQHLRIQLLPLDEGENILVAASIEDADKSLHKNLFRLFFFIIFANILAALLSAFLVRRSSAQLEKAQLERMQEFLGDAAHELRTPLTVIKGYSQLLATKKLITEEEQERAFTRLATEIARMESLIADLLILAELGEERAVDFEPFDISALLEENIKDFALLAPKHHLNLDIESSHEVYGSKKYMQRFFQNAFINIRQHCPENAPVGVTLKASSKTISLTIEDGGPGLPQTSYGEKIRGLKRFDRSRSRETGGTGLGMSIMSAVVEKHSGSFSLKPSSLGGLAIHVELPRNLHD